MSSLKVLFKSKGFSLILLLVIVVVVCTVLSGGTFLSAKNIRNILQSTTVVSLLTIGAGMLMIAGCLDLSLGGIGTMCALLAAYLLRNGCPWYIAIAVALILGGAAGAVNAVLVNELKLQSFIATLATASVTQGIGAIISSGKQIDISGKVQAFSVLGAKRLFDVVPYSLIISMLALLIYGLILKNTKFGRSVYLIGGSATASRLAGIRPKRISYILFINAGVLSALAGMLLSARLMSANTTGITNSQFSGMTAAILGGISFGGGTGGMGGALIGILVLNCFNNGMTMINVPPYWQTFASGALLIIALTVDYINVNRTKRVTSNA